MLPELDCQKAAKERQVFSETALPAQFQRLSSLLASDQGQLAFKWAFFENEAKQIQAQLDLEGEVELICQRCNAPFTFKISSQVLMQHVATEQEAERLHLALQPLYLNELNQIDVYAVLEDELILALPMIPMHEKKDCSLSQNQAYCASSDLEQNQPYKPFAGLAKLADLKEKKSGSSTK